MALSEERAVILRMIEEGKVSAEDGARLLAALNEMEGAPDAQPTVLANGDGGGRALQVRVSDLTTGKAKVNISIPIGLVSFALRFVPDVQGVDVQSIKAAIDSGYSGQVIDVKHEDDGHRIEVFLA